MKVYKLISHTCAVSYFSNRGSAIAEILIHARLAKRNMLSLEAAPGNDIFVCEDEYGSTIEILPGGKFVDHSFLLIHIDVCDEEPSVSEEADGWEEYL